MLEALVAMTIIFSLVLTIIPIHSTLQLERTLNKEKRDITYRLHDELLAALASDHSLQASQQINVNHTEVRIAFIKDDEVIKACASWEDVKGHQQKVCLYGYPYET